MRRTRSGNFFVTSISQATISEIRLIYKDPPTVIALRQLPHNYQQLYHAFLPVYQPSPDRYGWRWKINSSGRGERGDKGGRERCRGGRGRGFRGGRRGQGKVNGNQI